MTVARELAKFGLKLKYEDLPQEVIHEAKRALLDALGCAVGGYPSSASKIMQEVTIELGGPKEATVIGSGLRTSSLNAILANGVMVRYLDFNDTYQIPVGKTVLGNHPSDMIAAILAVAEREKSKGQDVIKTMVLGYELSARFNDCMVTRSNVEAPTIEEKGWNTDTRGAFIMPVVTGMLLGLSEEEMEQAIGISGSHNLVLGILDATGEEYSMTKNLRFPRTSYGGLMAALLARRGFTGPRRVIEGNKGFVKSVMRGDFDTEKLTEPIGRYKILDTMYKYVASDATTHGHVTATLHLVKEHDIKPQDVAEIRIKAASRCIEHTGDPVKRNPTNKESADHSSYYLTAVAILDRMVGPDQYTPNKLKDPRVREMIDKVRLEADPSLDRFGRAGISEIRTKQGAVFTHRVEYPKGDPRNPMTDQEIEEKFRAMAERFMTETQIKKVISTVYQLEKLETVNNLMRAMVFKD
jgi:2-methylcitrate dehydratase